MARRIFIIILCSSVSFASPLPLPADSPVETASPIPSPLPLGPVPTPLDLRFNNPYYNYAQAPVIPIVTYSNEHNLDGSYAFSFSTADGKQAEESGYVKDAYVDEAGNPQGTQVVRGSYSYISPDGTPVEVSYVADEYGFRPTAIRIAANRRPVNPTFDKGNKQNINPNFNPYNNPFLYGNQYFGQYNNGRPYDPRYGYNPTRLNPYFNNIKPYQPVSTTTVKPEIKKDQ